MSMPPEPPPEPSDPVSGRPALPDTRAPRALPDARASRALPDARASRALPDARAPRALPDTRAPRAWEHVLARLEEMLVSGEVLPGQRLPGERALAVELGVGRSSVREALRVLEALGLLRAQTGSGPNAGAMIVSRPTGGMSMLLRMQVAAQGFAVDDVVRTRIELESEVLGTLAAREPAPDLTPAEVLLDAMDDEALTPAEFLVLDAQFHVALADAAGNTVVAAMMAGLRDSIEDYVVARVDPVTWPTTCVRLRGEHRDLVRAVRARDVALARQRVVDHIRGYHRPAGERGGARDE